MEIDFIAPTSTMSVNDQLQDEVGEVEVDNDLIHRQIEMFSDPEDEIEAATGDEGTMNFMNDEMDSEIVDVEALRNLKQDFHSTVASLGTKSQKPIVEADNGSEMLGVTASSLEEAYNKYNEYAFKIGFSVRKDKQRHKKGDVVASKHFVCWKNGFKRNKGKEGKEFVKLDTRTGCKAKAHFNVDKNGQWTCTRHDMVHNHAFCPPNMRHLLRSQNKITKKQVKTMLNMVRNGVKLADAIRVLKGEAGGSSDLGFTSRSAYNAVARENEKRIDGSDSNTLMNIFKQRDDNEDDFYYDFEVDSQNRLCSFFWRDKRMKEDYINFGDVLIHDTTYRTNKYDMICGPFVGMNHHAKNSMFGCGFLLNERTESFIWLFRTFLRSMGQKHPVTIMTDQSPAMAAAIQVVFPQTKHRLCVWHLDEDARRNIPELRSKPGFIDLFYQLTKYTDTPAEFNIYWKRLEDMYGCAEHSWIKKLKENANLWCPAFSKDSFSGGVLLSQRTETTNNSVSRRRFQTAGLCDLYKSFVEVVHEWRSKEQEEDFRNWDGKPESALKNSKILIHARETYTGEIYLVFEEYFMKAIELEQKFFKADHPDLIFHVGHETLEAFKHEVRYNPDTMEVSCTCKKFSEMGILCCHCLRVYIIHCVPFIPERYVLKRWTREMLKVQRSDEHMKCSDSAITEVPSVWRGRIIRKYVAVISASDSNAETRKICEENLDKTKIQVEEKIGPIYLSH